MQEAVPQLLLIPKISLLFGFNALFVFLFLPISDWWTASILKNSNMHNERRKAAAEALGIIGRKIKDESIEEALIEALEDAGQSVRCTVAEVLGKVGSENALEALEQNERKKEECEKYKVAIAQIKFRIECRE
jgi:HEAT repeat protein